MQHVLNHLQVEQKITRLAHQIIEHVYGEDRIFLAGINGNGWKFAQLLHEIIVTESNISVELIEINMHKDEPLKHEISLSIDHEKMHGAVVVLADDVLNSGKTMQYALVKLLECPLKAVKTIALVDRKHRRFPIKCDFVGITLSTTLEERVEVTLEPGNYAAILE